MPVITSLDNSAVKRAASLKEKKHREETGLFLLEGERLVRDAAEIPDALARIILREDKSELYPQFALLCETIIVSERVFNKISGTENSQGVAAEGFIPVLPLQKPSADYLILDRVREPGNVGAILRTAAAAGFKEVYTVNCADCFSPKAVRASMGGVLKCRIYEITAGQAADLTLFPRAYVADMAGENIFKLKRTAQFCGLIIGNEANGVDETLKAGRTPTAVPMQNTESLNAAVSAGILMYSLAAAGGKFDLY